MQVQKKDKVQLAQVLKMRLTSLVLFFAPAPHITLHLVLNLENQNKLLQVGRLRLTSLVLVINSLSIGLSLITIIWIILSRWFGLVLLVP